MTNTLTAELTRPIVGIENRTAQEVFDIMSDRIKHAGDLFAEKAKNSTPVSGEVVTPTREQAFEILSGLEGISHVIDESVSWLRQFIRSQPRGYPFQIPGSIDIDAPRNEDEAAVMGIMATNWLEKHAPHRLKSDRPSIITALSPLTNEPVGVTTQWRHKKRGTVYTEIGRGKAQASTEFIADDDDVVIYRGEDGLIWVRQVKEFEDGRFDRLSAAIGEGG